DDVDGGGLSTVADHPVDLEPGEGGCLGGDLESERYRQGIRDVREPKRHEAAGLVIDRDEPVDAGKDDPAGWGPHHVVVVVSDDVGAHADLGTLGGAAPQQLGSCDDGEPEP